MSGLTRVVVTPSGVERAAAVAAALFAAGAEGLQELDASLITVVDVAAVDALAAAARAADAEVEVVAEPLPDTDWSATWRARVGAHAVGSLTIAPPWLAEGRDPARTVIIEPEMAFGTGEHETTRGVVRLMASVIRAGDFVADLGAGSAVLAIAAVKLGAGRVAAIEYDPDAIPNAEANVIANGVADRVAVFCGEAQLFLPLVAPVRVILANIISSVLLELLEPMREALASDGAIILSGILAIEAPMMRAALGDAGWRVVAEDAEGEWWSVHAVRA